MAVGQTNPLRQQMINMMYLVLVALLALNVSADILKAFAIVNHGLGETNESYSEKTDLTMMQFAKLYEQDQNKAQAYYDAAKKAVEKADEMFAYIGDIKEDIAKQSGGWTEDKSSVENNSDTEIAANIFINQKKGEELRKRLEQFREEMLALTHDSAGNTALQLTIDTQEKRKTSDGTVKGWTEYYFEGVPTVAAITELTKFQNDVRNAEAEVTNYLIKQVGADDFKFDRLVPIVSSSTPSVFQGQEFKAEIFLGAYSSTQAPKIVVGGKELPIEAGKGVFQVKASGMGEQKLAGKILVVDPATGKEKEYPFDYTYQVFTGNATISADKMNVLYIGLDNPISISVPGFRPDQVMASASGGMSFQKVGPDKYIAKPNGSTREATVNVSVKMPDGTTKTMGSANYRIRPVPAAEVMFGTKTGGAISRGELQTVAFVTAGLGPGFAFEGLKYDVNGYTIYIVPKNGQAFIEQVRGNRVPGNVKARLDQTRPGDMIVITEVSATGPTGTKIVNGPALTVK